MKKHLLLTIATLALTLTACGQQAPPVETEPETQSVGDQMCEKYGDVIDALEAEDYDGAKSLIDEMSPERETEVVEITLDNYLDYYEWSEDGIITDQDVDEYIRQSLINHYLHLKPEFEISDFEQSNVKIGYSGKLYTHDWLDNEPVHKINETTLKYDDDEFEKYKKCTNIVIRDVSELIQGQDSIYVYSNSYGDIYGDIYDDIEIVKAEGQIVLYK